MYTTPKGKEPPPVSRIAGVRSSTILEPSILTAMTDSNRQDLDQATPAVAAFGSLTGNHPIGAAKPAQLIHQFGSIINQPVPLEDGEMPPIDYSSDESCNGKPAAVKAPTVVEGIEKDDGNKMAFNPMDPPKHNYLRMMLDEDGGAVGYDNEEWKTIKVPKLRTIVSELHGSARGMLKPQLIDTLKEGYEIWQTGSAITRMATKAAPDKATANCKMRLLNVVFSDDHVEDFEKLLERPDSRGTADNSTLGNQKWFWGPVRDSYVDSIAEYGQCAFQENVYLMNRPELNLDQFGQHSWSKLRDMWNDTKREYKEWEKKYTESGTHANDFFQFTRGKLVMYYLHLLLETKSNILDMVKADLPPQEGREGDTEIPGSTTRKRKKEAMFTDLLGDLISDRSSGAKEMLLLIESRNSAHLLEMEKVEVTKALQSIEEDRRREETAKRSEETRASNMKELDDINQRLDRVRQMLLVEKNDEYLKEYKEEELTFKIRKQQLHGILFPKTT